MNKLCFKWMSASALLAVTATSAAIEVPAEVEAQYQSAIESRANGDIYGAIDQLNSLLSSSPYMHRARLELAVSYYRAARYEEARKNAQEVLSNPDTPDSVKETIQMFIDQLDSIAEADDTRRHSWDASISFGLGHDDNVNAGPGSESFDINGLTFFLDPEDGEQTDAFGTISGSVNHSYRMPGSVNIGSRPVQMLWQSGVSLYRKEYQDEHPYTVDVISLNTGPALISRTNWRASLDFRVDSVRLGDDELSVYTSANPSVTWVDGKNEYTLRGQWMDRDYKQASDTNREGERYLLGVDYTHNFSAVWALKAGVSSYKQDAKVDYREFDVAEGYLSAIWLAWTDGAVYARVNYRETEYDGLEPAFNVGREEDETKYILGASHNFKAGAMQGWGVGARFSYSDNQSNVDIYEYDRKVINFDLTKRF
jgi:tetratricopeptide (TPR) repeat protein